MGNSGEIHTRFASQIQIILHLDDTDITDITSAMKLCRIKSKKKTYIVSDRKEINKRMLMVDSLSFTPEFNIDSSLTKVKL